MTAAREGLRTQSRSGNKCQTYERGIVHRGLKHVLLLVHATQKTQNAKEVNYRALKRAALPIEKSLSLIPIFNYYVTLAHFYDDRPRRQGGFGAYEELDSRLRKCREKATFISGHHGTSIGPDPPDHSFCGGRVDSGCGKACRRKLAMVQILVAVRTSGAKYSPRKIHTTVLLHITHTTTI